MEHPGMPAENTEVISDTVFPSEDKTITVLHTDDEYGGAYTFQVQNCLGFNNGKTEYDNSTQTIQFVRKNADGTVIPGLQNEQLYILLIVRLKRLNAKYPDKRNDEQIACLETLLRLCKERVQERIDRGVMGELKK